MKIFHIFICTEERTDGALCEWPIRLQEGRVPRGANGRPVTEIEDFCKRCRRQGRVAEGEKSVFRLVRRENEERRIIEDIMLSAHASFTY